MVRFLAVRVVGLLSVSELKVLYLLALASNEVLAVNPDLERLGSEALIGL